MPPAEGLSFAGNFLHMLKATPGQPFTPAPGARARARRAVHPARRPRAELLDLRDAQRRQLATPIPYSSVAAAAAALYGPLHGGANEAVLRMLHAIGSLDKVPAFIKSVKGGEGRLMGFGHRVYKSYDPRARIVKQVADEVFEVTGRNPLLEIAQELERIALQDDYFVNAEALPERRLLLGADLRGDGLPGGHVHGALRHPAHRQAGWRSGKRC